MASPKGGFLASTLTLAAGTTGAQIITLALMPVITRLYDPQAFGVFAVFVALATVLISVSNLQFAEVIVIAPTESDADAATVLSLLVVAALSLGLAMVFVVFREPLAAWLGMSSYAYFLPLLSLAVLLGGLRQIARRRLLRAHRNRNIAAADVVNAVTDRSSTIGLFWMAPGTPIGMVAGRLVGQLCTVLTLWKPLLGRGFQWGGSEGKRQQLGRIAAQYSQFPRYSWAILLDNAAQQLPVIMISTLLGPAIAGAFALARRVLAEPAVLLGASVAQSFYQQAARAQEESFVRQLSLDLILALSKLLALPVIIALASAPELFALVFGEEWRMAGWYAFVLSPVFMLYLMLRPLNRIFDVKQMQREKGVYAAQNLILIACSLAPALLIKNPLVVLSIYAVASTVFLSYRCLWLLSVVGVTSRDLYQRFRLALAVAIVVIGAQLWLRSMYLMHDVAILACTALALLLYLAVVLLLDRSMLRTLTGLRGAKS